MDLIRELLFRLEEINLPPGVTRRITVYDEPFALSDHSNATVFGHLNLLCDADFIDGEMNASNAELGFQGLTWAGHDFLDSVRDPEIWRKTKDGVKAAGGFTVDLLGDIAKGLIKTQLKKLTGVEI
jgi:hypothetical protein